MDTFESHDEVVVLGCNITHIFHLGCLDNWVAYGNRECPLCR